MNYQKYADKAKNKLNIYGGDCKIIRKGKDEVYNPESNSYVTEETVIHGKGLLSQFNVNEINGTLIEQGDVKLMCSFDVTPVFDDIIEIGNVKYVVKNVAPLNPDGNTVIYYNLQLRKK